jgi:hypothetical protein
MATRTALNLLARTAAVGLRTKITVTKPLLSRGIALGRLSAVNNVRPSMATKRFNGPAISQGKLSFQSSSCTLIKIKYLN